MTKTQRRARFGAVLRLSEFRALFVADIQSQLGDQLARVALTVFVFNRSHSPIVTAGVFALTFVPAVLGGVGLGHLADTFPRRTVMIVCDLLRAALLALMAIPGMPIAGVSVLLVLAVSVGSVFSTAESAVVSEIVSGDEYAVASGVRIATLQVSQLVGFAAGGLVVAATSPSAALLLDAATFALSAALIAGGLRPRPAAGSVAEAGSRSSGFDGLRAIRASPALKILLGLSWLSGFTALPEGLAAPFVHHLGGGPAGVGVFLAANPAGTLVGTLIFVRSLSEANRRRLIGPLAVLGGVPLVLFSSRPGLAAAVLLLALTGLCAAYHAQVPVEFVQAVPNAARGQAIGIASSGLYAIQGVGLLVGGIAADLVGTTNAITAAGIGLLLAGGTLAMAWRRQTAFSDGVTESR